MSKNVIEEAKRCLKCKNPSCVQGCPVKTPIRDVISMLLESKLAEAGEILFENNPLSLVCSHVCPQENQCEGHCVLGRKGSPVRFSEIERYISDYYLNIYQERPTGKKGEKVAIIGSGPAGITIAFILSRRGYAVTIFEGHDKIGGVLRYGIPEFRLPKTILDRMTDKLVEAGVKIRPNTNIGTNITVDDLFRDGFRAIFMGTGVWRPNKLGIKGESLGHVHFAIEYLRNPAVYRLGKSIAVIGAGNVAMDVARTAIRNGCTEAYILNNMGDEGITARELEVEYAKIDGAKLMNFKAALEITDEGIILADTHFEGGTLVADKETAELFPVDSVIVAIGQGPRAAIVSTTEGIDVTARGLVAVDEDGRTSRDGVFASGDVVTGAKTVVEAVKVSRRVADAIDEYVRGLV